MVEAARWTEDIQRAHECIGGRLRRPELCWLLSPVEQTSDTYPPGVQRVLSTPAFAGGAYIRDAGLVDDGLRNYVLDHLDAADGLLMVDETACPRFHEGRFSRQGTGPLG